ncbi:hypothetical protein SAMN02799631_00323 [Methylobacterium sp. 174MFSha1.1]|uniref:hypothetical protein n=1 Tax=Methylobacterium sp. 174MFSha1.1 TaxID=1502749 RepID=UPI0008E7F9EF|nr:hypothetical protein [Methylobacterium sp. 174MFSha1.1]SFU35648.1 hypothetical protein SAMN02799631_00323 [Methylobacterium sp. 174MFSha1.1]
MPRRRLMPTDNVVVAEHAQGKSAAQMAADWEVTPAAVYAHWRRLGLNRKPAPVAVVPPAPPPEPIRLPVTPMLSDGRLSVDDLAWAVTLARREGITPDEAVRFVRADIDQARPPARPFVPDGPPARFSTYRMPAKLEAWYQALADGLDLPELEMADFDV